MSAKNEVKNLVTGLVVTIDDNVTPASVITLYAGGPETFHWLFTILGFDVVVTVDDPTTQSQRWIQDIPEHHAENVVVIVTTIDKTGVTGTKMQEKMRTVVRTAIEGSAHGTNYIVRILRETPSPQRKGGIDRIWETTYTVEYRDA